MNVKCSGHKPDGSPCKRWAVHGATVCRSHGAAAPQVRAKAAVRAEVMKWGLGDVHADPGEVLLRLVSQSAARVEEYSRELSELVAESPTLRSALVAEAYGEFGPIGEYVRGLAQLEAQERDRCAAFCAKAIAAGLAERTVRLAEKHGQLIAEVLRAVLADPELGLTEQQQKAVPGVARRVLALAQ